MSEAHCNNLAQRKVLGLVTHDNTGGPFVVECQGCGEVYPSFHCLGGEQIADTGDHEDARCPHCDQVDPEECDNAALAWNTQQLKINELQQRLNAADQRIDELTSPPLTDELRWILGQMCFQHIHTAQALRLMGHEIAKKAEDEQAVTIHWMLGHYLKDPQNWRRNASAELKAAAPAA